MPPLKGQMLKYSQEDIENAIEEVSRGSPIATAARKFGIPRVTLSYKLSGKTPRKCRMGPKTFLPENIENMIVHWIQDVQQAGFNVNKEQLLDTVQFIVKDKNIETPFKNNRPGRHWLECFMKRHPQISVRSSKNSTTTKAPVATEKLSNWCSEVYDYLKAKGYDNILQDPRRIFNADESAFFLNPTGNKVLARKGDKSVYQQTNFVDNDQECVTVLISSNAVGEMPPPMVIVKCERLPQDIVVSVPDQWGIGESQNGWMTTKTFYDYIGNIYHPWLLEQNVPLPVILFIDGHCTHLTQPTSELCVKLGIILVATQVVQPMVVSIFPALSSYWKTEVHEWLIKNNEIPFLKKIHFCGVFKKAIDKLQVSLFEDGFRRCGLYPWDLTITKANNTIAKEKSLEKLTELQDKFHIIQARIEKSKRDCSLENTSHLKQGNKNKKS